MDIKSYLQSNGPQLASSVSAWLELNGVSAEAARKRLSRTTAPIRSFPVPLFPKGARFMYLQAERETERFWTALHRDLRSTGSIYGIALDGLLARRGAVASDSFAVISGATAVPVKKQVMSETVLNMLESAGLVGQSNYGDGLFTYIKPYAISVPDTNGMKARDAVERITLDALRDWARNVGAASFNQIAIRGEQQLVPVQQFRFDMAGPSYLLPLRRSVQTHPGFLVADVFSDGTLDEFQIRYFIRKAKALHATLKGASVLPILVADGFTGAALKSGHAAGILMATPGTLFGRKIGDGLRRLLTTLTNAAAYASAETPDRIVGLVNTLADIEGRSQNLRGPLFELIAAYLVRRDAVSIDMGVRATDPVTREQADIDVLKVSKMAQEFVAIECKAREPGGTVGVEEISRWLGKLKVIQNHLKQNRDREAVLSFELWTTGTFTPDALSLLQQSKSQRTRTPISWKAGADLVAYASIMREKAIADVLKQHFLKHPLADLGCSLRAGEQ